MADDAAITSSTFLMSWASWFNQTMSAYETDDNKMLFYEGDTISNDEINRLRRLDLDDDDREMTPQKLYDWTIGDSMWPYKGLATVITSRGDATSDANDYSQYNAIDLGAAHFCAWLLDSYFKTKTGFSEDSENIEYKEFFNDPLFVRFISRTYGGVQVDRYGRISPNSSGIILNQLDGMGAGGRSPTMLPGVTVYAPPTSLMMHKATFEYDKNSDASGWEGIVYFYYKHCINNMPAGDVYCRKWRTRKGDLVTDLEDNAIWRNDWVRSRLHPAVTVASQGHLQSDGTGPPMIVIQFYRYLEEKKYENWTVEQKRLMMLMAGKYGTLEEPWIQVGPVGKSWGEAHPDNGYIPDAVHDFWEKWIDKVQNDLLTDSEYYKLLQNGLGSQEPTEELFAKHVTHGLTLAEGVTTALDGDPDTGEGIKGYREQTWNSDGQAAFMNNDFDAEEWRFFGTAQWPLSPFLGSVNTPRQAGYKLKQGRTLVYPKLESLSITSQNPYMLFGQDSQSGNAPLLTKIQDEDKRRRYGRRVPARQKDWKKHDKLPAISAVIWYNDIVPDVTALSDQLPEFPTWAPDKDGKLVDKHGRDETRHYYAPAPKRQNDKLITSLEVKNVSGKWYRSMFDLYTLEEQALGPYQIHEDDTILGYLELKKKQLAESLELAIKNSLTESPEKPIKLTETDMDLLFSPMRLAAEMVQRDYRNLFHQNNGTIAACVSQIAENRVNGNADTEGLNYYSLTDRIEDDDTTRSWIVQLWIDAVNAAAYKLREWAIVQNLWLDATIKYLTVANLQKVADDGEDLADLAETAAPSGTPAPALSGINNIDLPNDPKSSSVDLTEEEVKERLELRKKNMDQCLLLTNIDELKKKYIYQIQSDMNYAGQRPAESHRGGRGGELLLHKCHDVDSPNTGKIDPFGGRLRRVTHTKGQFSKIPNYLSAPKGELIRPLLNITPDIQSALTPKIRLFRISDDPVLGEKEIEFTFNNFVTPSYAKKLSKAEGIEKGEGSGIKSFSFTYEGGTPATATKDINAELVMYFQSFNELTKTRGSDRYKYKYIDLLLYPTNKTEKTSTSIHPNEYSPTNFRIRVDVGWSIRNDEAFKDLLYTRLSEEEKKKRIKASKKKKLYLKIKEVRKNLLEEFNKSLELTNKTFLLNMVDHDMDFRNDGTVEVKINYAAYIDSKLRTTDINALSTPQIEAYKRYLRDQILSKQIQESCNQMQLIALQRNLITAEEKYIKAAQGSIMRRLNKRSNIWGAEYDKSDVTAYQKEFSVTFPSVKEAQRGGIGITTNDDDEVDNYIVQYFHMGDLIYTLMDCLYLPAPGQQNFNASYDPELDDVDIFRHRRDEVKNFVMLLSSFTFTDYTKKEVFFTANIADIPISLEFFNNWMTENVVKPDRTVYPLIEFVKDLLKSAVSLMTDACINRRVDSSLMFQTGQFMGAGEEIKSAQAGAAGSKTKYYLDPLHIDFDKSWDDYDGDNSKFYATLPRRVDAMHEKEKLPLSTGGIDEEDEQATKNMYKYILLYPVAPVLSLTHKGRGLRIEDEKDATYHFQIGSDRGLLKNVSFSKTDMAYLREARFYNQGHYGLLQLGAVYNVELELYGNTIFYPGMEIFIDPRGFGGTDWDPTTGGNNRSTANALGIGGYHVITKVQSEISSAGFKTKLSALFQYSGDGESRNISITGMTGAQTTISSSAITARVATRDASKCVELLNTVTANNALAIKGSKK